MLKENILTINEFEERLNQHVQDEQYSDIINVKYNFMSIYSTTRHYGGPEEGGWWYNLDILEYTVPICRDAGLELLYTIYLYLCKVAVMKTEGNIYSINGGIEYYVDLEHKQGESENKERPHYE